MREPGRSTFSVDESGGCLDWWAGLESVITPERIRLALAQAGRVNERSCGLPHEVMLWVVIARGLFTDVPIRQVFKACRRGRRRGEPTPQRSSQCAARQRQRQRLGVEPVKPWHADLVRPLATVDTPGAFSRGLRWMGMVFDVPDRPALEEAFWRAPHQQCIAHLLKRCRELLEVATGGAVRFPRAVKELLQRGLAARDRYFAEELTSIGLKRIATGLTQELGDLVHPVKSHADHERFAKFLENHLDEVFPFLRNPDVVSATNNESESELRFNVIARKLSGGNRSDAGVAAQESLPSVIRTCRKLIRDPFEYLHTVLTSTTPVPLFPTEGR